MKNTKKLILTALFAAIGILSSHLFYIPIGISKCFPVQHAINILCAVILGPWYGVVCAFVISLIRNITGTGTLLAFPGSMIGALLAGIFYFKTKKIYSAILGELIGTGIFGGLLAVPISNILMNTSKGAFIFVIPFLLSSISGSVLSYLILKTGSLIKLKEHIQW